MKSPINLYISPRNSEREVKLKDGTTVQTGTAATTLHNLKLYNSGERGKVEKELRRLRSS